MGVCPVGAHKVTEHEHSFNRELCIGYGNLPWKRTYLLWKKVSADELLKDLKENGIHTAVDTCGFVPQFNADEIEKIGGFLGEIKNLTRVRVLAYHNFAGSKYEALPENEDLSKAAEILNKYI